MGEMGCLPGMPTRGKTLTRRPSFSHYHVSHIGPKHSRLVRCLYRLLAQPAEVGVEGHHAVRVEAETEAVALHAGVVLGDAL